MNKSFLEIVARDIVFKHGTDLSRTAVVFPNKRASLFLNEHLARIAGRPIWSPAYTTISELFRKQSELSVADEIKLVCDLHKSFVAKAGETESLDHFYGWGQLLLSDFDDIDKCLADAEKVFAKLRDYHELDDISYLSEEQKNVLKRFFSSFSDDQPSKIKEKFLRMWSHLGDIYEDFRERLQSQGLAYEGMLYRSVVENGCFPDGYERYIFVGFNQLHEVEKKLFQKLKDEGKAFFYWDFDHYYIPEAAPSGRQKQKALPHSASHPIVNYLQQFPNELHNDDEDIYGNLSKKKDITFISSSTENMQARYVTQWLRQNGRISAGSRTAIIVCNESLLTTIIHCLPPEVNSVNVTSGYPLQKALITSFINQLFLWRIFGGSHHYRHIMRHPYAQWLEPPTTNLQLPTSNLSLLKQLADIVTRIAQQHADTPFEQEALFRMYTLLNRLATLVEDGDLDVNTITLQRLLQQLIHATTIPFHGEPVQGIQIMGMLETRNLDFDHLIILSCNEGNLPRTSSRSSFIPHFLRKAFGLTTIDNDVSLYGYYFQRLLQRATDITLLYNNSTEDGHTGEMSQFMLQMLVEWPHTIHRATLHASLNQTTHQPTEIAKTPNLLQKLNVMAEKGIYPTHINRYLRCQLLFYYNHMLGIKEPSEEEGIDNRGFGNIFHRAAQLIYYSIKEHRYPDANQGFPVCVDDIDEIEKHPEIIHRAVDKAIKEEIDRTTMQSSFIHHPSSVAYLVEQKAANGLLLLNREVIIRYLKRLLKLDKKLTPFYILKLEEPFETTITLPPTSNLQPPTFITLRGVVDRLDVVTDPASKEEYIRVVDYKTGAKALKGSINDLEEVFQQPIDPDKHPDYYLQTFLYALLVKQSPRLAQEGMPIAPALLFIQHASAEGYDPVLTINKQKITDIGVVEQEFSKRLQQVLTEIFDPAHSFQPTINRKLCAECAYKQLCGL